MPEHEMWRCVCEPSFMSIFVCFYRQGLHLFTAACRKDLISLPRHDVMRNDFPHELQTMPPFTRMHYSRAAIHATGCRWWVPWIGWNSNECAAYFMLSRIYLPGPCRFAMCTMNPWNLESILPAPHMHVGKLLPCVVQRQRVWLLHYTCVLTFQLYIDLFLGIFLSRTTAASLLVEQLYIYM